MLYGISRAIANGKGRGDKVKIAFQAVIGCVALYLLQRAFGKASDYSLDLGIAYGVGIYFGATLNKPKATRND